MRQAVIQNGIVVNVIEAPAGFVMDGCDVTPSETAGVGDTYSGGSFTPTPVVQPPDVQFIPFSMLRQRVEKLGMLTPFSAYLVQNPDLLMKLISTEGQMIDPAYPAISSAFDDLELSDAARSYILAPPSAGVPDVPASS